MEERQFSFQKLAVKQNPSLILPLLLVRSRDRSAQAFQGACLFSCTCVQREVQKYHCIKLMKMKGKRGSSLIKPMCLLSQDEQSLLTEIVL